MSTTPVKPTPDTPAETVEERFRRLAAAWHRDTDYLSSMEESDGHPAYQEIIRLGPEVVPLLLRDLAANHTHWLTALEAITGARPVPVSAAGNIPGWRKPGSAGRRTTATDGDAARSRVPRPCRD
jgi:hypothetical protein